MSMEMMKKAMIGAAGVIALTGAMSANAADIYQDGSTTTSATATFTGSNVLLQQGENELTCNLSLTGTVVPDGSGGVEIDVTDGDVSGGFLSPCNTVQLNGFPWTASVPASEAPVPPATGMVAVTFDNVGVSTIFGSCTGSVDSVFVNNGPVPNGAASTFDFDGSFGDCMIDGSVAADPVADDIDVY